MKNLLVFLGISGTGMNVHAQKMKPVAQVESVIIDYLGSQVKARKLTVHSEIPMGIDTAWGHVKTPALLAYVAKGMIRFISMDRPFPKQWEVGRTYGVKMRVFGLIPFGGIHYLSIEEIDDERHLLSTQEWDRGAKVWDHNIQMRDLGNGSIHYEDAITIYGGWMTGLITCFAKHFYRHRQKRWQIVAEHKVRFGD
jgi:hypothetical protein